LSDNQEFKFSAHILYAGEQCGPTVDMYSTRILPHIEGMTELDAIRLVKEALLHIEQSTARLLEHENGLRREGRQDNAAGRARARAELMLVRAVLRGK